MSQVPQKLRGQELPSVEDLSLVPSFWAGMSFPSVLLSEKSRERGECQVFMGEQAAQHCGKLKREGFPSAGSGFARSRRGREQAGLGPRLIPGFYSPRW